MRNSVTNGCPEGRWAYSPPVQPDASMDKEKEDRLKEVLITHRFPADPDKKVKFILRLLLACDYIHSACNAHYKKRKQDEQDCFLSEAFHLLDELKEESKRSHDGQTEQ